MFDERRNEAPTGAAPSQLTEDQRDALFHAEVHVLPSNWTRARTSWLEFGRMFRADHTRAA